MHDSALSSNQLSWREIVDRHHSSLIDELTLRLDSDLQSIIAQALAAERARAEAQLVVACDQTRTSQAELLNQSLRRLRTAGGEQNVLQTLSECCAPYTASLVVLVFENNQARVAASHGFSAGEISAGGISFDALDIVAAPAIVSAIESRDPVVALAADAELSPELAQAFRAAHRGDSECNAYLFPLIARHSVVAMLVSSGSKPLMSAPVELLCEAAGMRLESLLPPPERARPAGLVQLASAAEPLSWNSLSPDDQKLHLQAQRMARVRVAEMRLNHENELRDGVASSDIYGALRSQIDNARDQFRESFLSKSRTMVDYLHLTGCRSSW